MPPREAKARLLTREYMADRKFMATHDAAEREFYLLLALFSDDGGWLTWDPSELAGNIYRWDNDRDELFGRHAKALVDSGRLRTFKCGHAFMPKVAGRPRSGGREYGTEEAHKAHARKSTSSQPNGVDSKSRPPIDFTPVLSSPNQSSPNLTEGHRKTQESTPARVSSARARGGRTQKIGETEELSEFKRRVEQEGGPVKI